jgi:hypothetical protein
MTGKIFINYRRGDDPGNTGRLFDRLQEVFASGVPTGAAAAFMRSLL